MPPKNVRRLDPADFPDLTETGVMSIEKELIDRVFRDGRPEPQPKSEAMPGSDQDQKKSG